MIEPLTPTPGPEPHFYRGLLIALILSATAGLGLTLMVLS